ncbi:MAG: dihydrolipoyl dehydrogenase, partial [Clostridium sp.]|nr:dihydrolipoyl dehydrogenase [Clostridium sp.]
AHVASREATCAVENIMGRDSHAVYHAVPRCLYTHPEIGAVGLTEAQAQEEGIKYKKGIFSFAGIGKALVIGQTGGFVKILVDENDKIIGAAVVGPEATDLLTELTLAVHLGLTAKQVGEVIHPHPTLSEALMEALHDVHKESVHAF